MPLSDGQIQALLVQQVGDTENGALAAAVVNLWDYWTNTAGQAGLLRDLYVKRDLIGVALGAGGERTQVTVRTPNLEAMQSDRAKTLLAMLTDTQKEIEQQRQIVNVSGVPEVGQLTAVAMRTVDDALAENVFSFPDGNMPQYRGDLYRRGRQWR